MSRSRFRVLPICIGTCVALIGLACGSSRQDADRPETPKSEAERFDLLVGSCDTKSVLRYDGETGESKGEFVKSGSGGLDCPEGDMVIGPDGDLYVSSFSPRRVHPEEAVIFNDQVLRFDGNTGEFKEVVVEPSTELNGPHGLAFGPENELIVGTRFSGTVSHVDRKSGRLIAFQNADPAGIKDATSLQFGPDGRLLVADYDLGRITTANGESRRHGAALVDAQPGLVHPHDMTTDSDGKLYVTNYPSNEILRFDARTGEPEGVFVKSNAGGLDFPAGMEFGPDNNLFVTSCPKDMVLRFDGETGEFMDVFVKPGSGGLKGATGMVWLRY